MSGSASGVARPAAQTSGPFRALCLLLALAFVLGGGSRSDIQSLIVLRPAAVVLLCYGLARLEPSQIRGQRFLFAMAAAMIVLLVLHLIPMPPSWWSHLPGRGLVLDIDRTAELGAVWRPLSLAPDATRNALFAMILPSAALVLGVQLSERERAMLLWPVLVLGALSAVVALCQMLGGGDFLRFYRVTNESAALGLFANRNHQALLLATMPPCLAAWSRLGRGDVRSGGSAMGKSRTLAALIAGVMLIPLVLVTGSRAGLVLTICALIMTPAIIWLGQAEPMVAPLKSRGLVILLSLVGITCSLAAITVLFGKGLAWDRLVGSSTSDDLRFQILPTLAAMVADYLPLGSGLGSFAQVYQIHEPAALLTPLPSNHAHGDWLEQALTGGLPAIALLTLAAAAFVRRGVTLFSRRIAPSAGLYLARLGAAIIMLCALGSLADYPLRVPSLACYFVVAAIWMSCSLPKNQPFDVTS